MTRALLSTIIFKYTILTIILLALLGLIIPAATVAIEPTVADLEVKFYEDELLLDEPIDGDNITIVIINNADEGYIVHVNVTLDGFTIFDDILDLDKEEDQEVIDGLKVK